MLQNFFAIRGSYESMVKLLFQETCQSAYLSDFSSPITQSAQAYLASSQLDLYNLVTAAKEGRNSAVFCHAVEIFKPCWTPFLLDTVQGQGRQEFSENTSVINFTYLAEVGSGKKAPASFSLFCRRAPANNIFMLFHVDHKQQVTVVIPEMLLPKEYSEAAIQALGLNFLSGDTLEAFDWGFLGSTQVTKIILLLLEGGVACTSRFSLCSSEDEYRNDRAVVLTMPKDQGHKEGFPSMSGIRCYKTDVVIRFLKEVDVSADLATMNNIECALCDLSSNTEIKSWFDTFSKNFNKYSSGIQGVANKIDQQALQELCEYCRILCAADTEVAVSQRHRVLIILGVQYSRWQQIIPTTELSTFPLMVMGRYQEKIRSLLGQFDRMLPGCDITQFRKEIVNPKYHDWLANHTDQDVALLIQAMIDFKEFELTRVIPDAQSVKALSKSIQGLEKKVVRTPAMSVEFSMNPAATDDVESTLVAEFDDKSLQILQDPKNISGNAVSCNIQKVTEIRWPELQSSLCHLLKHLKRILPWVIDEVFSKEDEVDRLNFSNRFPAKQVFVLSPVARDQMCAALKADVELQKNMSSLEYAITSSQKDPAIPSAFYEYCKAVSSDDRKVAHNALKMLITQYPNWHVAAASKISTTENVRTYMSVLLNQLKQPLSQYYHEIKEPDGRVKLVYQQKAPVAAAATFVATGITRVDGVTDQEKSPLSFVL